MKCYESEIETDQNNKINKRCKNLASILKYTYECMYVGTYIHMYILMNAHISISNKHIYSM